MKIIQVINTMILNSSKITNVVKNEEEFFFLYDKKYKWSISRMKEEDKYFLHFYPTDEMTIEQLSEFHYWEDFSNFITYKTEEIKTKEAIESFSELYKVVAEKVYGLDTIFDEIINS